jgi:hypothetical protein
MGYAVVVEVEDSMGPGEARGSLMAEALSEREE